MSALHEIAGRIYYGNTLQDWAEAVGIFLLLLVLLPLLRMTLDRRLRNLKPHESPTALELAIALYHCTTRPFVLAVAAYFALKTLKLPPQVERVIDIGIEFGFWFQAALWAGQATRFAIDRRMRQVGGDQLPTLSVLRFVSVLLIWSLALLEALAAQGIGLAAPGAPVLSRRPNPQPDTRQRAPA